MFCKKCGAKLNDDMLFCPRCGTKVVRDFVEQLDENHKTRTYVCEGDVHKCPCCGEPIKAFSTKCPSCGYEFRDSSGSAKIEEFSRKIQELENKRAKTGITKSVKRTLFGSFVVVDASAAEEIDKEIASLIRNFYVPNTVEDLTEFLILACSNIKTDVDQSNNYDDAYPDSTQVVNNAWTIKATQVYQKAQISFGETDKFKKVEAIYLEKIKSFKKSSLFKKRVFTSNY